MPEYKLITCMVPGKISFEILERLKTEMGIITADKIHARGTSSNANYMVKEMEILTVVVEAERADEIFEYLFYELEIDQPNHGILLQNALGRMTGYTLPELEQH